MPIRYLYIDDDTTNDLKPLIDQLKRASNGQLEIDHYRVMAMSAVRQLFSENNYDGLIVDQKLDAPNEKNENVDYYGTSLAQNFRTDMAASEITSSPIILLSNEKQFVKYYDPDESSHNLFDYVMKKDQLVDNLFARKSTLLMTSLVDAYSIARQLKTDISEDVTLDYLAPLFQWNKQVSEFVDSRFVEYVKSKLSDPHALVNSIYSTLIRSAGSLVTEQMLATKLGINIENSSDWIKLIELFNEGKYQGIFSELKERWWFSSIEDWWEDICEGGSYLQGLTCEERVEIIKGSTGLNELSPIQIKYVDGDQSQKLWVNCIVSGTPLDPYDALRARDPLLKAWEQPKYLDIASVLKREAKDKGYLVHTEDQAKRNLLEVRLRPSVQ